MPSYDINLYQSEELTNYCEDNFYADYGGQRAAEMVKRAILAVFDYHDDYDGDYSVSVSIEDDDIDPPFESKTDPDKTFSAVKGCSSKVKDYYTLAHWLDDRLHTTCRYKQDPTPADDANLLLTSTSATDGGYSNIGSDGCGFAQTGQKCADEYVPRLSNFDTSDYYSKLSDGPHDAVMTAIHEIGHSLTVDESSYRCINESNDGSIDHRMTGYYFNSNYHYTRTAMWNGYQQTQYQDSNGNCGGGYNYCGNSLPSESQWDRNDLRYSDCTVNNFK